MVSESDFTSMVAIKKWVGSKVNGGDGWAGGEYGGQMGTTILECQ